MTISKTCLSRLTLNSKADIRLLDNYDLYHFYLFLLGVSLLSSVINGLVQYIFFCIAQVCILFENNPEMVLSSYLNNKSIMTGRCARTCL